MAILLCDIACKRKPCRVTEVPICLEMRLLRNLAIKVSLDFEGQDRGDLTAVLALEIGILIESVKTNAPQS